MKTMQEIINNIQVRKGMRSQLEMLCLDPSQAAGIMLCEILDDMLEQRIQSDKVIEGILKDIQGGVALVTDELTEKVESG